MVAPAIGLKLREHGRNRNQLLQNGIKFFGLTSKLWQWVFYHNCAIFKNLSFGEQFTCELQRSEFPPVRNIS